MQVVSLPRSAVQRLMFSKNSRTEAFNRLLTYFPIQSGTILMV